MRSGIKYRAAPKRKFNELHYDNSSAEHPELGTTTGQLSWVNDAAGTEYYGYDARGRISDTIRRWSDGTEHHSWTDYDAQDRVTERGFPDSTHLSMSYDSQGMLSAIGPLATHLKYTPDGALSSIHFGNGIDDNRTYDQRRRLYALSAVDATGAALRSLKYTLDSASHVVSIADLRTGMPAAEDLTAGFTYDDRYRLKTAQYQSGRTDWQLDDISKVLSVKSDFGDKNLNVTNAYGESGAPADQLTHHGDEALKYDAAGRLIQDAERTLTWDAKGRLSKVTRGDTEETYFYGHDDERILKITKTQGQSEVTRYIDKDIEERNGQLVRYAIIGGQRTVRLDAADAGPRTAPVTNTGAIASIDNALSDARPWTSRLNARFAPAIANGSHSPWLWPTLMLVLGFVLTARIRLGSPRPLPRRPGFAGWTLRLVPALALAAIACLSSAAIPACSHDSQVLTVRDRSVEITTVPDSAEFYLSDIQGTPVVVLDAAGKVVSRSSYHPYGQVRYQTAGHRDPFGFVANEEDRGSGLSDFHARSYRPELGIFLSVDPIALLAPEQIVGQPSKAYAYAYGEGNPVDHIDPEGKQSNPYQMPGEPQGSAAYISAKAHAVGETLKGAWNDVVFKLASQPAVIPYAFPEAQRQAAEQAEARGNAAVATFGFAHVSRAGQIAGGALVTIAEVVIVGKLTDSMSRSVKAASRITKAGEEATKGFAEIATPYGLARQGTSAAALEARASVESGATLYRIGTTGKSNTIGAQFWSLENPTTPGYAARYGIPAENVANSNFIQTATLRPGASFVTRAAPAVGKNPGGGVEAVVAEGGVISRGFAMH